MPSSKSSSRSSSASSLVASSSSASSSARTYSSVLKSTPTGSSSRSSSISRSSTTSLSSATSSFSPKSYLTIHDLYMRYAPLKSLTESKSTTSQVSLPRVLPPMTLKDLFNKFAPKTSAATPEISSSTKTANPPAPQPPPSPQPTQAAPYEEHTQACPTPPSSLPQAAQPPTPLFTEFDFDLWPHDTFFALKVASSGFRHEAFKDDPDDVYCVNCDTGVHKWKGDESMDMMRSQHKDTCWFRTNK